MAEFAPSSHRDEAAQSQGAGDQLITVAARRAGSATVLTVQGEVDMLTTPKLRESVAGQLSESADLFVLDLSGLTFLGSSGLAVLVETLEETRKRDLPLRLVCNTREVTRPLAATGLTDLFDIYPDIDAALATVS